MKSSDAEKAYRTAQMPEGTKGVLNARSLQNAHRGLGRKLRPGMSVLDIGCGTGTITQGIAETVGSEGRVVGVDINTEFIEEARSRCSSLPGLSFEACDAYSLPFENEFDIVTCARVLQWLAQPLEAIRRMVTAANRGGRILALEYNHEKIEWQPRPPSSMQKFYAAFLKWRADAGISNTIADDLSSLFSQAGLENVTATSEHEVVRRVDPDFVPRASIWAEVASSRGHQMVRDSAISAKDRALAEAEYREWVQHKAQSQCMYLLSVEGLRP